MPESKNQQRPQRAQRFANPEECARLRVRFLSNLERAKTSLQTDDFGAAAAAVENLGDLVLWLAQAADVAGMDNGFEHEYAAFLECLVRAEAMAADGELGPEFVSLVHELSGWAVGPIAEEFDRNALLRRRLDVLWAATDRPEEHRA